MAIVAANAKAMQARSVQARKANRELRERMLTLPQQPAAPLQDDYTARRIMRVRKHIGRIDAMIRTSKSAQELNWLLASLAKAEEIERNLSGRPLPGSYRPGGRRSAPTLDSEPAEPVEPGQGI